MKKNVMINTVIVILICSILFLGSYTFFTGRVVQDTGKSEFYYNGLRFTVDNRHESVTFYVLHYLVRVGMDVIETESPLPFRNDPREIDNLPCEVTTENLIHTNLKRDTFYLTQDPTLETNTNKKSIVAMETVSRVLADDKSPYLFDIDMRYGYTSPKTESPLPVVTCEDATPFYRVIVLREASKTGVFKEGDCVYVQGPNGDELIKAAERFVYAVMGVIA